MQGQHKRFLYCRMGSGNQKHRPVVISKPCRVNLRFSTLPCSGDINLALRGYAIASTKASTTFERHPQPQIVLLAFIVVCRYGKPLKQ
ncbi:hypothetical protein BDV29DRAFT_180419 [Aspergillus leporis]|uniref:Uncharacterized protein n=1 Tax=Aspergillus leporis TaxID=41062 RepID=A0A5N5WQB7_9EURO|nr:hypothetical protein BDV29DRAFT_180419 [Aspergillus leporis]